MLTKPDLTYNRKAELTNRYPITEYKVSVKVRWSDSGGKERFKYSRFTFFSVVKDVITDSVTSDLPPGAVQVGTD